MIASPAVQHTQLRLEQTLAQWRHWRCDPPLPGAPHILHSLPGGLSNHNYLVQAGAGKLVIRLDGVNPVSHGLSRHAEWLALQSAADAGIAPRPRYFNPELGALVVDYHEADTARAITVEELCGLLHEIHALPPRRHRVDIGDRIALYLRQLERRGGAGIPAEHLQLLRRLVARSREHNPQTAVLTHNDLLPANLLFSRDTGSWLALDWEYSGMGTFWFDLAVASIGQDLDEQGNEQLLACYLRRPPTPEDADCLCLYRSLAAYLSLAWHLLVSPGDVTSILEQHLPPLEAVDA